MNSDDLYEVKRARELQDGAEIQAARFLQRALTAEAMVEELSLELAELKRQLQRGKNEDS